MAIPPSMVSALHEFADDGVQAGLAASAVRDIDVNLKALRSITPDHALIPTFNALRIGVHAITNPHGDRLIEMHYLAAGWDYCRLDPVSRESEHRVLVLGVARAALIVYTEDTEFGSFRVPVLFGDDSEITARAKAAAAEVAVHGASRATERGRVWVFPAQIRAIDLPVGGSPLWRA